MLDDSNIDFGSKETWKVKQTKESEYIPCCLESSWLVNLVKVCSLVKEHKFGIKVCSFDTGTLLDKVYYWI